jgi:hypothetical protein
MTDFSVSLIIIRLIERSQRLIQRLLKRSLGDRTWNRDEISSELKRINLDVQSYLSVHTVGIMFVFIFAVLNILLYRSGSSTQSRGSSTTVVTPPF